MMHTMSVPAERFEGESAERVTVTLPASQARLLRAHARMSRRSVSSLVREGLDAFLSQVETPPLPSFTGVGASEETDLSERGEDLGETTDPGP
jgi:hypothetical protein